MPDCRIRNILSTGISTGIVGVAAIAATLCASEARASQPDTSDTAGSIIISRDVYYRSAVRTALGPSVPGEARTVDVSPDDIISGALTQGLKPLSDMETANMAAPVGGAGATIKGAMQGFSAALGTSEGQRSAGLGQLSGGGSSGGGGIIGQALSSIPTALNSMRAALGVGK